MARGRKPQNKKPENFRRANGSGCVCKLSGNRRKPYIAIVTTGFIFDNNTLKNRQIQKSLGTYATREEAESALAEYNLNPYDLNERSVTFGEIYEIWKKRKFPKLSDSTITSYNAAYKYCKKIKDTPVYQLKTAHLQEIIDSCDHSFATQNNIKTLMNGVFTYCMQNDIVSKNYTEYLEIEFSDSTFEREIFSKKDIDYLWSIEDDDSAKVLLILLYTGMRVNELLKLPKRLCHLEEQYPYFDIPKELAKNNASIRQVPIPNKVLPLVKIFYDRNNEFLMVKESGARILYNNFVSRDFKRLNKAFETEHHFHDTRHTFITKAHELGLDNLCLKKIVGHTSKDITSRVYTHITMIELYKEICKIDY